MEKYLERFFEIWRTNGLPPVYLVGGAVRCRLLSLAGGDLDVASSVPPERLSCLESGEISMREKAYGLGTVCLVQKFEGRVYPYEYTAFRCDNYGRRGGAHTPAEVTFTDDISLDAQRRDFTVNALYMDEAGTVLDPTGRGLNALSHREIEQIAPETLRSDALRILRMVRFSAELGFTVEKETLRAAKENTGGLADISGERIRNELAGILLADAKYGCGDVLSGLHLLKSTGALRFIFPALCEGDGMKQNPRWHAYDVLEHALHACACAPSDLVTRLAALLHDVAKPEIFAQTGRMYGHDARGAEIACRELLALRFPRETAECVRDLVAAHMFDLDNRAGRKAVVRMIVRLGREQFLRLCDLREADFAGSGRGSRAESAEKWRAVLADLQEKQAPLAVSELAVNGNDLMRELGIPQGKAVGELLSELHRYALKKPSENHYKNLIRYAKIINTYGSSK